MSGVREGIKPEVRTFENSRATGTGRDVRLSPSFKVPSERFFHKNFKTGLTFLNNVVLKDKKLSPKLSTYGWDTVFIPPEWKGQKKALILLT